MTDEELYKKINAHLFNEIKGNKQIISELFNLCEENEYRKFKSVEFEFKFLFSYVSIINLYYDAFYKDMFIDDNNMFKEHFLITSKKNSKLAKEKDVDKAIGLLEKALKICNRALSNKFSTYHIGVNYNNYPIHYKMLNINIPTVQDNKQELIKQKATLNHSIGTYYAFYKDVNTAVKYLNQAIELGSKSSYDFLVYIYTQDEFLDLEKALSYYNTILEKVKEPRNELEKSYLIKSYLTLFFFYHNNGLYEELKSHCVDFKNRFSEIYDELYKLYSSQPETKSYVEILKLLDEKFENTEILSTYFSNKVISKMPEEVKIFLITSLKVKKFIEDEISENNILDFSSAIMPAMKALESVLFNVFAKNYLKFLNNKFNEDNKSFDFDLVDDKFIRYNKDKTNTQIIYRSKNKKNILGLYEELEMLEFGPILHLSAKVYNVGGQLIINPNSYFVEFCAKFGLFENSQFNSVEEFIKHFVEILYKIKELRNLTAHKGRVTMEESKYAFEYLIEQYKFINLIYETFCEIL